MTGRQPAKCLAIQHNNRHQRSTYIPKNLATKRALSIFAIAMAAFLRKEYVSHSYANVPLVTWWTV